MKKFNPLSDDYDSSAVGAIDNVINKGTILVTNESAYKKITYTSLLSDIKICKNLAKLCSIHTVFYVIYSYHQILYFKAEVKLASAFSRA